MRTIEIRFKSPVSFACRATAFLAPGQGKKPCHSQTLSTRELKVGLLNSAFYIVLVVGSLTCLFAATETDRFAYETGLPAIQVLSADIYQFLTPVQKALVSPRPICLENSSRPSIRLVSHVDG